MTSLYSKEPLDLEVPYRRRVVSSVIFVSSLFFFRFLGDACPMSSKNENRYDAGNIHENKKHVRPKEIPIHFVDGQRGHGDVDEIQEARQSSHDSLGSSNHRTRDNFGQKAKGQTKDESSTKRKEDKANNLGIQVPCRNLDNRISEGQTIDYMQ